MRWLAVALVLVPAFLLSLLGLSAIATVGDAGRGLANWKQQAFFLPSGLDRSHDCRLCATSSSQEACGTAGLLGGWTFGPAAAARCSRIFGSSSQRGTSVDQFGRV